MDFLDSVLQSASNVTSQVIDAWGRVKVASYDAQVQPPPVTNQPLIDFGNAGQSNDLLMIAGIALVAVLLVLKS